MHITTLTAGLPLLFTGNAPVELPVPAPMQSAARAPLGGDKAKPDGLAKQRFDLRALRIGRSRAVRSAAAIQILPLFRELPGIHPQEDKDSTHEFDFLADEALIELFSEQRMDQIESIEMISENVVELVAPPQLIEEFAALVELLEGAVFDSTPMQVVRFEDDHDGPSGILSIEALEKHLDGDAELRSRRTMQLLPGALNELHDIVAHDVVIEVDMQIAQGSAVSDTVVKEVPSGTSLWTMATRNGRGVQLCYALSSTTSEELDGNTVSGDFMLGSEGGGLRSVTGFEWEETLGLMGGVAAGDIELMPGEAMILSVGALGDDRRQCVALCLPVGTNVSVTGASKPLGEGRTLWSGPAGETAIPSLKLSDFGTARARETDTYMQEFGVSNLSAQLAGGSTRFVERLENGTEIFGLATIPGSVLVSVPSADVAKVVEYAAASFEQDGTRLNVRIAASTDEEPLSQIGALSLTSGRTAGVAAGSERLIANESDVEVAQFAAGHDPVVMTHFEGLRASISLIKLSGGRLAYSVQGSLSVDVDEDDLKVFGTEGMTAIDSEMLILNQSGTKVPDDDGGWTILLGDESGQGQRVRLKVRAVE